MRINWCLLIIGLITAILGIIMYLIFRPIDSVQFFSWLGVVSSNETSPNQSLRPLFLSTPSFIHVFSFSLITTSLLNHKKIMTSVKVVFFWLLINLLAEIGQLASRLELQQCFEEGNSFYNYFCHGTFDSNDVIFSATGGIAAFVICLYFSRIKSC